MGYGYHAREIRRAR